MQKMLNLLNKLEIWIFYGFLITLTLSVRKVLFFYPIRGEFNEYTGIYLYLSDIFILWLLLISGLSILCNNISLKSRYNLNFTAYLKQKTVIIPLLLVILSFISAFWSDNWQITIFRSIKLLEFYFLYLWVIFKIVPRGTILKNSIVIIIITGLIQSIIGIWQFIIQRSIGLIWLKESIISPEIPGVAKVVLNGCKYIRSYGLFPHPNILGGFLIISIVLTIVYFKMLKNSTNVPPQKECSTPEGMFHPSTNVPRGTFYGASVEHSTGQAWNNWLYYTIMAIQILALILTFSKSAIGGLLVATFYLATKNTKKMFHVEHLKYVALTIGILFLGILVAKPNYYSIIGKSLEDRMFYLNVSRGTFIEHPWGIGSGQFVLSLEKVNNIQNWQFQPVHNVFLLVLNELGIIGLILLIWFIWEIVKDVPPQKECSTWNILWGKHGTFSCVNSTFKAVFFGFLFIMLFDHYFWDIQQGQIMLWLVLGLISGSKMWISREPDYCPQDKAAYIDK